MKTLKEFMIESISDKGVIGSVHHMAKLTDKVIEADSNEYRAMMKHGSRSPEHNRASKQFETHLNNLYKHHEKHLPPKKDFMAYDHKSGKEFASYWHPEGKEYGKKD